MSAKRFMIGVKQLYVEFAFWSSVEGRGLHVEGEGNMLRVQKKKKKAKKTQ